MLLLLQASTEELVENVPSIQEHAGRQAIALIRDPNIFWFEDFPLRLGQIRRVWNMLSDPLYLVYETLPPKREHSYSQTIVRDESGIVVLDSDRKFLSVLEVQGVGNHFALHNLIAEITRSRSITGETSASGKLTWYRFGMTKA